MTTVIGIRFKEGGKVYYFDPDGHALSPGDCAVVETARGPECGTVAMAQCEVEDDTLVLPLRRVIRPATEQDMAQLQKKQEREREAFAVCTEKIAEHGLEMKLVEVEAAFDNSKLLFYFTADGRIDFRELVRDLASVFRTRIELRQIGVRDESKMIGGLGVCGRPFCCASFLNEFQPVSIKMAKDQGLSLNLAKISGTCGRLMCCLKYEQSVYDELLKITPRVGSSVATAQGNGTVIDVSLLKGTLRVRLDGVEDNSEAVTVLREDVQLLSPPRKKENKGDKPAQKQPKDEKAEDAARDEATEAPSVEEAADPNRAPRQERSRRGRGGRRSRSSAARGEKNGEKA